MPPNRSLLALAGAAAGIGAGIVAEHSIVRRRRRNDPEGGERFGTRRGVRPSRVPAGDGVDLSVEEAGPRSRRGAVFVHGSALRTDVWHYQIPGLGDHRLVFYDLRGHGFSDEKGEAEFSVATLAQDLARVIDQTGLEEVVVVGHSLGGMVALELALGRPEMLGDRLKGLVLANTTFGPAAETLVGGALVARLERVVRRPLDVLGSQHQRLERLRNLVRASDVVFWAVALAAFGPHPSAKQVDFVYDMVAGTRAEVIFDLVRSYRAFDVRERLGEITVPALVLAGTHDRLTVPEASVFLAEHLPKAELTTFEGCGHMSMLERHRQFNGCLTFFLNDVLGRPGT